MTTREAPAVGNQQPGSEGLRASDTERERTVEVLRTHYETGHIGYTEFNDRMERAYQATHSGELGALVADLPGSYRQQPAVPAVSSAPPAKSSGSGVGRVIAITGLVIAALVGLSWLTGLVTSHPVIAVAVTALVVWLVVKKPFRRRA